MTFTLEELATLTGGELIGDPAQAITGVSSLRDAVPGEVTFLGNRRFVSQLRNTRASAAFVPLDFAEQLPFALIRVANPAKAFEQVVLKMTPPPPLFALGIHPTAVVSPQAIIGERVSIQPLVVIEAGARIGDDTLISAGSYIGHDTVIGRGGRLYPNVTIRERVMIGSRVIIHSGVVIGADGFGFELIDGVQRKIPQLGTVQIDDDVEIGANATIDRARFGRTWIKRGAKLDNMVHVGHNVVIGEHSVVAAQTGLSGSSRVGDYVFIGGQVGVADHAEIADRNMLGGRTGVTKSLPAGGVWWGMPATPFPQYKKQLFWIHRLGNLFERVKTLEKKLGL